MGMMSGIIDLLSNHLPIAKRVALLVVLAGGFAPEAGNGLEFGGQLSGSAGVSLAGDSDAWMGGRYLPRLDCSAGGLGDWVAGLDCSVDFSWTGWLPGEGEPDWRGRAEPYRLHARYSSPQAEFRLGLQQINFGQAVMLRPLAWFDRLAYGDPLGVTPGVWALLGRYYFLNNANLWLWGLYGNDSLKRWETWPSAKGSPEMGGRLQLPLPKGESALSYHYRRVEGQPAFEAGDKADFPEHRLGLDGKWDLGPGLWAEAAWFHRAGLEPAARDQLISVAGADYTFGPGNGLNVVLEHLTIAAEGNVPANLSGLSLSYPLGPSDKLKAVVYSGWQGDGQYLWAGWESRLRQASFHLSVFWALRQLPGDTATGTAPGLPGRGLQALLIINH
jgi:hypothetical protein